MNNTEWKFHLEKYSTPASRHRCPACGDKKSFARYVDDAGVMVDESVGRCNHESSCGYHLTPHEFFDAHAELSSHKDYSPSPSFPKPFPKALCVIPQSYVDRSRSDNSSLAKYLLAIAPNEQLLKEVFTLYHIGATKTGATIFWQIDRQQRVRTGKVIPYKDDGHRDKASGANWIHSIMKKQGALPADWSLTQCLFGEHLLTDGNNKNKLVAVVESEKTAIICATQYPGYLWLATGGKSQLCEEKMRVLTGRTVLFFPDVDGYEEWSERVKQFSFCDVRVSDLLLRLSSDADREAKIDIADLILREWTEAKQRASDTVLAREMKKLEAMIDKNPCIQLLIDKLDLELVVPED